MFGWFHVRGCSLMFNLMKLENPYKWNHPSLHCALMCATRLCVPSNRNIYNAEATQTNDWMQCYYIRQTILLGWFFRLRSVFSSLVKKWFLANEIRLERPDLRFFLRALFSALSNLLYEMNLTCFAKHFKHAYFNQKRSNNNIHYAWTYAATGYRLLLHGLLLLAVLFLLIENIQLNAKCCFAIRKGINAKRNEKMKLQRWKRCYFRWFFSSSSTNANSVINLLSFQLGLLLFYFCIPFFSLLVGYYLEM